MKITKIVSHVLQYDLPEELGYSQQLYAKRTTHLVEVQTDQGVTGWGECFGPGNIAVANKGIVAKVIQPMILGDDPIDRDVIWHKVYNILRDQLLTEPLDIQGQVARNNGMVSIPTGPELGVEPDREFLAAYAADF